LIIAIADNISDSLSINVDKESESDRANNSLMITIGNLPGPAGDLVLASSAS